MIKQFRDKAFELVTRAHNAHLSTESYAQHVALGDFYSALEDKVDDIVETYQGCFGNLDKPDPGVKNAIAEFANWIEAHKEEIAKENDIVENQLDEIGALLAKTYYKLENLK